MIETNCFEETIYWLKVLFESLLKPSSEFSALRFFILRLFIERSIVFGL